MLVVADDVANPRLDRWFRAQFPHIPQSRIEKMCRKGDIRVDGGRVKTSTRLEPGQSVRIPPLPEPDATRPAAPKPPSEKITAKDAQMLRDCVIFRDEHIIAINKPAGLPVQGGSGQRVHVDGLSAALVDEGAPKPKLVHRIDKDTSGILVLALTSKAAAGLAKSFQMRSSRKIYWAAVAGVPQPKSGTIRFGLVKQAGHGPHGAGEKMVTLHPRDVDGTPGAKRATTDYTLITNAAQRTSWVALSPITGRTHQLRAHMAAIGAPIIGDGKYGTNSQTNEGDGWGAQLGGQVSRKLHLHARSLTLQHPVSGAELALIAPLPDHMSATWSLFDWSEKDATLDPFEDLAL